MAGPAPRPQTRAEEYGLVSSMIDVSDPTPHGPPNRERAPLKLREKQP